MRTCRTISRKKSTGAAESGAGRACSLCLPSSHNAAGARMHQLHAGRSFKVVHSPSNDKPALPASGACHYNDVLIFLISRITGQEAGFSRVENGVVEAATPTHINSTMESICYNSSTPRRPQPQPRIQPARLFRREKTLWDSGDLVEFSPN
jgi:hypothetical protein